MQGRDHHALADVPGDGTMRTSRATRASSGASRGGRRRSTALSVGFILLMLGLIAFAVYQCARHLTVELNTLRTQQITDTVYADLELYVFRDEAAVEAGEGNVFLYDVQDGEKVPVGKKLFEAYRAADSEAADALQAQLELYGTRIAGLESASGNGTVGATAMLAEAEKRYREALASTAAGQVQGATRSGEALMAALEAYRAAANGDSLSAEVDALRQEQAALVTELRHTDTRSTNRAGWFFYESDGLESVFTVEQAKSLTPDKLSELAATVEQSRDSGSTAGRMLYSSLYYLAATLPAEDATRFEVGVTYRVLCGDAAESQMLLTCETCDTADGQTLLVFTTQDAPTLVTTTRRLIVQTVLESTTGYRVPTGALVSVTSPTTGETVTGVYVLGGNRVEFARVEILTERDGYVIVKTEDAVQAALDDEEADPAWVSAIKEDGWSFLKLNDRMITGGRNLYEGKVIS